MHGRRWLAWVLVCASLNAWAGELELDLTPSSSLKGVLVLPPVATVVVGKKGAFVGVDTRRAVERFDVAAHRKLVTAFDAQLSGKVLPADMVLGLLSREGVGASALGKPPVLARLAKAAKVEWLVVFSLGRTGLLTATLVDPEGRTVGENSFLSLDAAGLTEAQATTLAGLVVPRLMVLEKARVEAVQRQQALAAQPPPPPPEEEHVDAELQALNTEPAATVRAPQRSQPRALVAVGPGASLRDLAVSGDGASALAELEQRAVVGLGVMAQVLPLEFFAGTAGRAWSQLSLEVHYRRAFVHAEGVAGAVAGETCPMTDDELQLRAGWRYRLGEGYLPTLGVAGGWAQEQTRFQCSLPLLSTTWRGVDAQLRVRQPLFRDVVTLELLGGPRWLLGGGPVEVPTVSFSGEAWLEVKPVSVLFARAGARVSRLEGRTAGLSATDTRTFLALELGAFF